MATLFVGDIHGCRDELAALLDKAGADRVVLVGDLYTRGPDPAGVWQIVRKIGANAVLGNHDERLLLRVDGQKRNDEQARKVVEALDASDPDREWLGWLRERPLFIEDEPTGFTVVHASLHPSGDLRRTTRQMALRWRRWPDDDDDSPLWHQVYRGDRKAVFGHDARRGLIRVEKAKHPLLIGLDTGCVYGGKLSGYLAEQDRIVQVPAKMAYSGLD